MAPSFQGNCLSTLVGAGVCVAGCTIILVTAFPVVQIVLGVLYMDSCPVAPLLPVHVLVSGVGALLLLGALALPSVLCQDRHTSSVWTLWVTSLGLLYLAWFLYGSYLVYSMYPPQYTDSSTVTGNSTSAPPLHTALSSLSCHRSLYLFTFWTHTLVYVFAGNALVILLCLCGFMKISDVVVKYFTS